MSNEDPTVLCPKCAEIDKKHREQDKGVSIDYLTVCYHDLYSWKCPSCGKFTEGYFTEGYIDLTHDRWPSKCDECKRLSDSLEEE